MVFCIDEIVPSYVVIGLNGIIVGKLESVLRHQYTVYKKERIVTANSFLIYHSLTPTIFWPQAPRDPIPIFSHDDLHFICFLGFEQNSKMYSPAMQARWLISVQARGQCFSKLCGVFGFKQERSEDMLRSGWCCCRHAADRRWRGDRRATRSATAAPPLPSACVLPYGACCLCRNFRIQKSAEPFFSTSNTARGETLRKFLKLFHQKWTF